MINSHKEFVGEMKIFAEKMDLINEFKYIKDVETLESDLGNNEPRTFLLGLEGVSVSETDYNMNISYRFAIADEVLHDDDDILNSESENMFIVSALHDYLNYIKNVEVDFNDSSFSVETSEDSSYTSVTGTFNFVIKRSASYWKEMEAYSTN